MNKLELGIKYSYKSFSKLKVGGSGIQDIKKNFNLKIVGLELHCFMYRDLDSTNCFKGGPTVNPDPI